MIWRSTLLLSAVAAALLWPASALGKGTLTSARLCGQGGRCVRIPGNDLPGLGHLLLLVGQGTLHWPPPLQGYGRLRTRAEFNFSEPTIYVAPAAGLLESGGNWVPLGARLGPDMRALARRIPLFVPRHVQAFADGTPLPGRRAAAALLGALPGAQPPARIWESRIVKISFDSRPSSPWSDTPAVLLDYFPRYSLLELPGFVWRRVPPALDGRLRRAAGWTPPAPVGSRADSHLPIIAAAAAALIGALVLAEAGRRRRPQRPRSA